MWVDLKLMYVRLLDSVRGHVRSISRARRSQWLPWPVVCIRLQVLDLILVHHTHQVNVKLPRVANCSHPQYLSTACG